jgi:NAD-dependent dihydropyrimidine dehydrogenase PreA subunit
MCEEYGDGGLWYLKPENYARNMYKLRLPGEGFKGAEAGLETGARERGSGPTQADLMTAIEQGDAGEIDRIRVILDERTKVSGQPSQVLPLRDAEKVLEFCSPIGLIACLCRKGVRAIDERNEYEYTCMGMGVGMLKWERWPERYKGGVKFLNVEEAKEWTRLMDKRGFCHILMLFGAPFIGGFCQCDYPDCGALRGAVDNGMGTLKAHYVAQVDYDICNGCGICAARCQWGALKFEATTRKANIDQFKCYGCGLCETGCPREAIKLIDRTSLPALAEVWQ